MVHTVLARARAQSYPRVIRKCPGIIRFSREKRKYRNFFILTHTHTHLTYFKTNVLYIGWRNEYDMSKKKKKNNDVKKTNSEGKKPSSGDRYDTLILNWTRLKRAFNFFLFSRLLFVSVVKDLFCAIIVLIVCGALCLREYLRVTIDFSNQARHHPRVFAQSVAALLHHIIPCRSAIHEFIKITNAYRSYTSIERRKYYLKFVSTKWEWN